MRASKYVISIPVAAQRLANAENCFTSSKRTSSGNYSCPRCVVKHQIVETLTNQRTRIRLRPDLFLEATLEHLYPCSHRTDEGASGVAQPRPTGFRQRLKQIIWFACIVASCLRRSELIEYGPRWLYQGPASSQVLTLFEQGLKLSSRLSASRSQESFAVSWQTAIVH